MTAGTQVGWNRDVALLRKVPATIRFVSVEPMPGPIQAELDGTNWCICGGETIKPGQKNDDGSRSVSND